MKFLGTLYFFTLLYFYIVLSKLWKIRGSKQPNTILYLAAFYPDNAGYHWRVKKWADELENEGFKVTINYVFEGSENTRLKTENFNKFLIQFLRKRFWQVVHSAKYETVIVRRELLIYNDYGNLFLEKMLLKIHPNAILDFDDDLSAAKNQPKEITNITARLLKEHGDKFNASLNLYNHFIVASNYLKERILSQNKRISAANICVIPTCVDYDKYPAKNYDLTSDLLTFGWIGNDNNYFLLDNLIPIFNELSNDYSFKLLVIGGSNYTRETKFPIEFIKWGLNSEVENLLKIDVGLMPLIDDEESKGKGGFKLIQYMGLGIVSIASPITINKEIVSNHEDSFLAMSNEEWDTTLRLILDRKIDLNAIGKKAKEKIERKYTFTSTKQSYIEFINYVRDSRNLE